MGQAAEGLCLLTRLSLGEQGGGPPLPPATTDPIRCGDAKMEFSEYCQREPHKEEPLGDRAGGNHIPVGET